SKLKKSAITGKEMRKALVAQRLAEANAARLKAAQDSANAAAGLSPENSENHSFRKSWFDLKLMQAGPTRKQIIAEKQKQLAWDIHRQNLERRAMMELADEERQN